MIVKWIVLVLGLEAVLVHQLTGHRIHRKFLHQIRPGKFASPTPTAHERHGMRNHWHKDWGTIIWFALLFAVIAYFFIQPS